VNGIVVIDKPTGLTSRDVVNKVSSILKTKKIGHTGTLDPLATGVLVLTIGKCTKLSELITNEYKTYEVKAVLGYETDTLDTTGRTIRESDKETTIDEILDAIKSFKGTYLQEVPAYSAVKVNGKRLYEYARDKTSVELPKREVTIKDISNISINNKTIKFKCTVSKGTYIRSLIRDIGIKLNTYATMSNLRRTTQGKYTLKDAYTLNDLENNNYKLISLDEILKDIYTEKLDDYHYKEVSNGVVQIVDTNCEYVAYTYNDEYIALYKKGEFGEYKMYVKF